MSGPPTKAKECLAWFTEKVNSIPAEYSDTAQVEIDRVADYRDSYNAQITIYYDRPETKSEEKARLLKLRASERQRETSERATLARLKAKWEAPNTKPRKGTK